MNLLDYLIPFIFALGLLIFVHELGHYLVARWCDVKVLRFSIGFGRPLLKWKTGRDQTEWALAAFPLGGYVKMLDEREGAVAEAELSRAFNRKPVGQRFAIVAAGPLANFLLAIVLYWVLFASGTEELKPRVALTDDVQSIAAVAGVRDGDLVVDIDGEGVRSWTDLRWVMLRHAIDRRTVTLRVRTADDVEAFRQLDFSGVRIDERDTDLIGKIGLRVWRPRIAPVVGRVLDGSAAQRAGLLAGDEFVSLGGEPLDSWHELVERVRTRAGEPLEAVIRRGADTLTVTLTPDVVTEGGERLGRIGISVAEQADGRASMFTVVRYGPLESAYKSVVKTWETSALTLKMIGRMITGDVSWKNLSGPVTIADYAGQSARLGWGHYLGFVALISISLGVLNLLPIPVLDGGHLLYYTIEIIKGGPVSERVMEIGQQIGLVALAMLMAFAFYNDITRLISG
ncbi:MAG: RIP metalloprotease RseP [Rhodocyclaceae bacterium]|jgi:regulator of sigma E protease|nr:RIP metalloprotease RseP [Rhodocyclaceae bacterium]MCL4757462.1 RIP metalloprotease RseP [Rhodocyclaceae bacterium]